jgi:AcrR family transcriptional regulator
MGYTRLDVDERRRRLLELGARLFTEHAYDELSMAQVARQAGISKALLYHYFPSKQDYFLATVGEAAEELRRRTEPDPSLPPAEQLRVALDGWLGLIEENARAYVKLMETAGSVPEIRALIAGIREATAERILDGLAPGAAVARTARTAVRAWLWFMDGACLDWVEHGGYSRNELRELLLAALKGSLNAAGAAAHAKAIG